jgi:hypothetical protein
MVRSAAASVVLGQVIAERPDIGSVTVTWLNGTVPVLVTKYE